MNRARFNLFLLAILFAAPLVWTACSAGDAKTKESTATPKAISVAAATAEEQPISRFIRVTGSLMAEEQADVAAETAGRVVAAPIERGSSVVENAELVRLSSTETDAQLREAEANAAQIEARLGMSGGGTFDVNAVPEVQNAKASYDLAQSEFNRIKSLLDQKVVSQSEYDQRRTQMEATRQQVPGRQERRVAAVSVASRGAGARCPRPKGVRRHRRARTLHGSGGRAARIDRRLRHARYQGCRRCTEPTRFASS